MLGLKENIDAVKKEISTEEQFLEGVIKSERFFKKYKKIILASVVVLVVGGVSYAITGYVQAQKIKTSNKAYQSLQTNPKDASALEVLKDNNERLYNLFLYTQAVKEANTEVLKTLSEQKDDPIISDLSAYQYAGLTGDSDVKSELFKGLVLLQDGYKLLLDGKINEAKLKFAQIELNSPIKNIANSLEHYQGK